MSEQEVELAMLRKDLEMMQSDMAELKADVKQLATAWKTAENLVAFIKWLAGLGAALALLVGLVKGWFFTSPKE
jgi:prefoldin subunit 5